MRLREFDEKERLLKANEKLTKYKTAAGADATAADASGNFARGHKRFKGINAATKKQFDNDAKLSQLKDINEQGVAEGSGDSQITPGMKTQYGTVVKVNGNTVTVKASNGELTTMNIHDIQQGVAEEWSQKYKNSINCSHPKGFSQRAHCAGKKKHNESIEMEMVCEDCGMCQTHGSLNEIKKGEKDSNGYTRCWPGKHAEGTKTGQNGGQVRNCVPNESVNEQVGTFSSNNMQMSVDAARFRAQQDLLRKKYGDNFQDKPGIGMHYNQDVQTIADPKKPGNYYSTVTLKPKDYPLSPNLTARPSMAPDQDFDYFHKGEQLTTDHPLYNRVKQLHQDSLRPAAEPNEPANESIEESNNRCRQCGMINCKCPGDSCKCKPIAGWIPNKGFRKAAEQVDENQLDELSKDTLQNYVRAQPARIKGPAGLATTNNKKAARIVDPVTGDIRRALDKYKDPEYGQQRPRLPEDSLAAMRRLAGVTTPPPAAVPNGPRQYRHMPTAVQPR